jgi:hypothetical protein
MSIRSRYHIKGYPRIQSSSFLTPTNASRNKKSDLMPISLYSMASNMSWQVQDLSCYNSFKMDATQDTSLSVALLIPLDDEHKTTGAFRLVIFGGGAESVPINAEEVFSGLPVAL